MKERERDEVLTVSNQTVLLRTLPWKRVFEQVVGVCPRSWKEPENTEPRAGVPVAEHQIHQALGRPHFLLLERAV